MATATTPEPPWAAPLEGAGLALLATLQLADSAFPAGLYAFSHGLETAVQEGHVRTAADLEGFLCAWLGWQVGPGDSVIVAAAHRATASLDLQGLLAIDARCLATKLAREAREASQKAGRRLLATAVLLAETPTRPPAGGTSSEGRLAPFPAPTSPAGVLQAYGESVAAGAAPGTHAAAFGAAGAALGLPAGAAILAELHSAATTCLGAALRLLRVDHQQTQGILRRLAPRLVAIAGAAEHADWQHLRPTAPAAEILQMRHEGAHVRLFMS